MAGHSPQFLGDQIRLPVVVIDAIDYGVLKGDPPSGSLKIIVAGGKELLHIISPVHRHDL